MAKPKKKKLFSNRIMAIAGLFTAGSIVGSSVDFDSLLELNYTIPSLQIPDFQENTSSDDGVIHETARNTIQASNVQESDISDTSVTEPVVQVIPKEQIPEPPMSAEQELPEQPIVSEPLIEQKETEPSHEPETTPVPTEDWRQDDWMEAIFVPEEQPEIFPAASTDWMEESEVPIQTDTASANASSMTYELAVMLEGIAVFWTTSGDKIHLNPSCRSFEENTVRYTGTLEEAQTICTEWCKLCAEHLAGTDNSEFYIKGNIYSTKEILLNSYTYRDCCNGIPAN